WIGRMDPSHKGISIMPFLFAAHQGLTTNRLFSNKHLVHPPSNWKIVSHHLPYLFHLPASNYRSAAYIFYTNVDMQCRSNLKCHSTCHEIFPLIYSGSSVPMF